MGNWMGNYPFKFMGRWSNPFNPVSKYLKELGITIKKGMLSWSKTWKYRKPWGPPLKTDEEDKSTTNIDQDSCCKLCKKGKACGDTCIANSKTCTKNGGCACDVGDGDDLDPDDGDSDDGDSKDNGEDDGSEDDEDQDDGGDDESSDESPSSEAPEEDDSTTEEPEDDESPSSEAPEEDDSTTEAPEEDDSTTEAPE